MMSFSNVRLIFAREVRDQLRDRRTLFVIAVLPMLLYPLLGVCMLQITQFMQEHPSMVLVVGSEHMAKTPPLFEGRHFAEKSDDTRRIELHFASEEPRVMKSRDPRAAAVELVNSGAYDAVLYFPPDFAARLDAFHASMRPPADKENHAGVHAQKTGPKKPLDVLRPKIIQNSASEKSRFAAIRLLAVLQHWIDQIGDDNLRVSGIVAKAAKPFSISIADTATVAHRSGAIWSKMLPVLLLLWTLTGAFYPAIDLCAGEKERGTLETLLSSPAQRSEIVWGKLLTIMLFSMATALLNLLSMGVTGWIVLTQMTGFGLPPLSCVAAMLIALPPISALFSALCLALAAFARSTKEGQYYLMPLLLIVMPLVVLPMLPGVELNLGNSLIPVTGIVLLLRSVFEGRTTEMLEFLPVVSAVTVAACIVATRWAVEQFNSESVLFREGERWNAVFWLKRLLRDRRSTPSPLLALCCASLILAMQFFLNILLPMQNNMAGLVRSMLLPQLLAIATPVLLMTLLFTRSPRETLLLKRPAWRTIPAAALLAVALHPTVMWLQEFVQWLYPISKGMTEAFAKHTELLDSVPFWLLLVLVAVLPPICEEFAFRGFILSGFRHLGHKWQAIIYSGLAFGFAHCIWQQSLIASLVGMVLAYIAVQSGSILPGMVYHCCHNALGIVHWRVTPEACNQWPALKAVVWPALKPLFIRGENGSFTFGWPITFVGLFVAAVLLAWFHRLPYCKSAEEALEEAIARGELEPAALLPDDVSLDGASS